MKRITTVERTCAIAVFVGVVGLLLGTNSFGFVRDEGYYFRAAQEYHAWFAAWARNVGQGEFLKSFSRYEIDRYFGYNTEHPGFVKLLMGWTWQVFNQTLGWLSFSGGFRLASMVLVALGAALTFIFGAQLFNKRVAILAIVLLFLCPHVFFHSHLACFDGPIMGLSLVVCYAFWRALESRAWVLMCGAWWGLALATKHNAAFLLPTLLLSYGFFRRHEFRFSKSGVAIPPLPLSFVGMVLLAPVVFYAFYPFGWPDPFVRIASYYQYHLHHEHYPVDFFGTLYTQPPFPWFYAFRMSVLTIPLSILVLGVVGLVMSVRNEFADRCPTQQQTEIQRAGVWILAFATLVPPLVISSPNVPIFGGTKHWIAMMPPFCIFASWAFFQGFEFLWQKNRLWRTVAATACVVVLGSLFYQSVHIFPYGHTYYNELVGGPRGGAMLSLPRTFWGGDGRELLDELNRQASANARFFTHRMNYDSFVAYKKDNLLRSDVNWVGDIRQADWALVFHQREYQDAEYDVWAITGDKRPYSTVMIDGIPIVSLYQLRPE